MYDRILIAVDGSEEARHAARRGLGVARAADATVHVVAVVERKALRLTETSTERARVRERAGETLAAIETLADELDYPVTTHLAEGSPADRIAAVADEQGADLIVVGRQGLTGLGRRLLGGVTERLVHRSDVPVLVVPGGDGAGDGDDGDECARVLVTTDGSEAADAAIPHGVGIARQFGASLHVVNVVDIQAAGGVFGAGGLEREFLERLDAEGRRAVEAVEGTVRDAAPELDVTTAVERTSSFEGAPAGIRAYVAANDIDLVVMGSRGRSGLRRGLLGSVASGVLRTVDVPVVVVQDPE
jgi:nucleotide-binding universal stress UspA family protein